MLDLEIKVKLGLAFESTWIYCTNMNRLRGAGFVYSILKPHRNLLHNKTYKVSGLLYVNLGFKIFKEGGLL